MPNKLYRQPQLPSRYRTTTAIWLSLSLLIVASLAFAAHGAFAQSKVFHNDRYDSNITVNQDGSLDIQETLVYVYDSGSFHRGTRFWDTNRLEDITNIQVTELSNGLEIPYRKTSYDPDDSTSGTPLTYGVQDTGGQKSVRWVYPYTPDTSGSSKTFRLSYHVDGAVRVYSDRDEFDWYAVPPDWQGAINSSRVQVTFPQGFDANSLAAGAISSIPRNAEVSKAGNQITWTATGNLQSTGFEVGTQLPKGILNATIPSWQAAQDRMDVYNQKTRPIIDLGILILSLLIAVLGVLWVVRRWYTKGRDKPTKLFSDYITEPPSNLPPGLVGTLIDESADVRDVIATVVDMGRKGNLTIQETKEQGFLTSSQDFQYKRVGNKVDYRFEEMLMDSMFGGGNDVSLSGLKNTFYSKLPPIYDEMYKSLVALKYFPENPKTVRSRNIAAGFGLMVLGAILFGIGITVGLVFTTIGFLPGIAVGLIGLAWVITAGAMPRRTDFGAEETAKWRAFGNYLSQIQKYTDVQAAADKFQQYLPYAVALGIEQQLIHQFNNVPTAMPPWYAPYGYSPFGYGYFPMGVGVPGQQSVTGGGGGPTPGFDPGGAMQGMSNSLAGAMQGMSNSFTTMVNSASSALTSQPQSSGSGGGGWGGGGGSFGGGGGGGGGGGAD